jgi:hypothetical protein
MADEKIVILNQGWSSLEQRTSKTGKQRFVIETKSEPLAFNLSPTALGAPIAQALAQHWRAEILAIAAKAAPATLKARETAARAFAAGKSWAQKRYSGGRIGAMPPAQSEQAFNDSGRFAKSVTANASKDGSWRINVAANRLSGDASTVERIYRRLVELVPSIGNVALAFESNDILRAQAKAVQNMITKGPMSSRPASAIDFARAVLQTARNLANVVGE